MYPILFQHNFFTIGSFEFITIGSYGVMLGLAFYLGFLLFERELKFLRMDTDLAYKLLLTVIPGSIIGAKIFHILDHREEFIMDPRSIIFSCSGLSVYGGLIVSLLLSIIVIKLKVELPKNKWRGHLGTALFAAVCLWLIVLAKFPGNEVLSIVANIAIITPLLILLADLIYNFVKGKAHFYLKEESALKIFDIAAPAIALGYGLGRFGCHTSGDGCYGIETASAFGIPYPNGYIPTSLSVFPTPLFESLFSIIVMGLLLNLRKKNLKQGTIFFIYLILNGISRFLVEFIRRNPKILLDLSQAQLISISLMLIGAIGIYVVNRKSKEITA